MVFVLHVRDTLLLYVCVRACGRAGERERASPLIYAPRWSSGTKQMSVQSSNLNDAYLFIRIFPSVLREVIVSALRHNVDS